MWSKNQNNSVREKARRKKRHVSLCGADLLVLVGCYGGEDGLGEAEGLDPVTAGDRLGGGEVTAEILANDVYTRLVLVHGVKDDLEKGRTRHTL